MAISAWTIINLFPVISDNISVINCPGIKRHWNSFHTMPLFSQSKPFRGKITINWILIPFRKSISKFSKQFLFILADDELAWLVVHRSSAAASQVWPGTVKWIENKTIQLNKIAIWIDFQFCPWVKNGITFYCTWNHNYHKSMWSNLQKVCCGLLGSLSVSALSKYLGNIRSHNEWSQARRGEAETNVGVSTLHRRLSPLVLEKVPSECS